MQSSETQKYLQKKILDCFNSNGIEATLKLCSGMILSFLDIATISICIFDSKTKSVSVFDRFNLLDSPATSTRFLMEDFNWQMPIAYPDMSVRIPVVSSKINEITWDSFKYGQQIPRSDFAIRIPMAENDEFFLFLHVYIMGDKAPSKQNLKYIQHLLSPLGEKLIQEVQLSKLKNNKLELPKAIYGLKLCPELNPVMEKISRIAKSMCTVLISGETGVGKELVAEAIHQTSLCSSKAFIPVNCGALPESLIDSLLFGHEKGAFTGAFETHIGLFESANGGTLFLDEIGELPLTVQVKLLRVLETGIVQRVGSTRKININVRIIAATNRNLKTMVAANTFRQDLWYRLCTYPINVPPLRERKADILPLSEHFLNVKSQNLSLSYPPELSDKLIQQLYSHDWQGNVRELSLVLERALLNGKIIDTVNGEKLCKITLEFDELPKSLVALSKPINEFETLDTVINRHINEALKRSNNQIAGEHGAATLLNVHPNTLRYRKKKNIL